MSSFGNDADRVNVSIALVVTTAEGERAIAYGGDPGDPCALAEWLVHLPHRIDRLRRAAALPRLTRAVGGRPLYPAPAPSQAISNRQPPVVVEYDGRNGQRARKRFANAHEARRFYAAKDKAGKNPQVKKAE